MVVFDKSNIVLGVVNIIPPVFVMVLVKTLFVMIEFMIVEPVRIPADSDDTVNELIEPSVAVNSVVVSVEATRLLVDTNVVAVMVDAVNVPVETVKDERYGALPAGSVYGKLFIVDKLILPVVSVLIDPVLAIKLLAFSSTTETVDGIVDI